MYRFNYMAVSDTIQRRMPTMRDRETGQPLAFPEAVLLTNPSDPQFKGQVTLFLYALSFF
jgi:rhamnogalacturonan endolyase